MAVVPFANSPHHLAELVDNYLIGIQAGNTQDDVGRAEMKYVELEQLRTYITKYFGKIFNFRDAYDSATPDNAALNDLFLCSGTFTEEGVTYTQGQFYAYSLEQKWVDVTEGIKGPKGDAAGFGTPTATVDANVGTPSVEIVSTGPDTAKIFSFIFHNLKGVKGDTGEPFAIYRTYASIAEMNADFDNVPEGKFVIITSGTQDPDNAKLYVRGASAFTFITDLSGAQGIQGPQGIQGETGATGNGISSIVCRYAVTTTQTQPDPADITSSTIPAMSATDKYLWQKMVVTYTSGSAETFVVLATVYGDTGATGPQGASVTIASQSVTYQVSDSGTVEPTGEWVSSVPVVPQGKFLWTRTIVTYSPSGSTTSYSVAYQGEDGQDGSLIDPIILFDGTKATYERVMRAWFVEKGALTATPAELTALCNEWYTITRAGWNGYVVFNQPSQGSTSAGTKGGDNADLVCVPSTDTVHNQDDYEGLPLFAIKDCNWTIDPVTLEPVITEIEGITSNFKRYDKDVFVGVLQMAPYHWYDDSELTYTHGISDKYELNHKYCNPVPDAVRLSDNTMRPWVVHSKYTSGKNGTKLTACAGVTPWAFSISHNTSQTYAHNIGTQYSGMCNCDRDWLVLMFYIKYGSLTADGVIQGCVSYNYQYYAKVAETGVTRVLLSTANAANILVGSTLLVGAYAGSTDRYSASLRSISDIGGFKVLSKETVTIEGVDYTAINFDAETPFDTAANGDATTGTTIVSTFHWRTGTNDAVLGNDGSIVSATNGKYPAKLQGIEYSMGAYEVLSDTILKLYQDAGDEKYYYEPYHVNEASKQATSITANYVASGLKIEQPSSSSWQYPKKLSFNGKTFFYEEKGGSSSTYLRDGFYMNGPNTVATREWLLFGSLDLGSGIAGLSAGIGTGGLSYAAWYVAGRLSPNGNRGEWAA